MAIDPSGISKALSLVRPARIESVREFRGAQQFSIGRELQSPNLFPLATLEIVEKPTAVRTPNGLWIRCGHESLIHRLLADVGYLNGFTAFGVELPKGSQAIARATDKHNPIAGARVFGPPIVKATIRQQRDLSRSRVSRENSLANDSSGAFCYNVCHQTLMTRLGRVCRRKLELTLKTLPFASVCSSGATSRPRPTASRRLSLEFQLR